MTQYYSNSKEEFVNINDMNHQHVWYAFKKLCDRLEELGICEHIWEDDYALWNQHKFVRKDVYEMLFDKCDHLQERLADLHKRLEGKSYREVTAPRYVFSEIPNDCDGQRFVDDAKKYFNRSRYNMRVRGQHIKDEYKGTGATAYGQNIEQSTHLRVYIEEK